MISRIQLLQLFVCITALVFGVSDSALAQKRIALVIGNGAYANVPPLSKPASDALAVADRLSALGYQVTKRIDRTRVEMNKTLREFARQSRNAEIAVLYYSGYGIQVHDRNFFVPIDANLKEISDTGFELLDVSQTIAAVENSARVTLVFLDASRENPFLTKLKGATKSFGKRGLAPVANPGRGTLISFAAQPGKLSIEDTTSANSRYTAALLKFLPRSDLSISQMLTKVRRSVFDATAGKQTPRDYNSLLVELHIGGKRKAERSKVTKLKDQLSALEEELRRLQDEASKKQKSKPKQETKTAPKIKTFKDCDYCPTMIVLPAGEFTIGSPRREGKRRVNEGPQKKVKFGKPIAVGRFEVTVGEFKRFIRATGQKPLFSCWASPGFLMRDQHPTVCVTWEETQKYVAWLSKITKKKYRLLTEAEWEYAARSGRSGMYGTPNGRISDRTANYRHWFDNPFAGATASATRVERPLKVQSYKPNRFGLFNMHGNVAEWVRDCYVPNYEKLRPDGRAQEQEGCSYRIHRGGGWNNRPWDLRAAARAYLLPTQAKNDLGFRVARSVD